MLIIRTGDNNNGKQFLALGGELHNSSASDLSYMDRVVWPSLRQLGAGFYLAPVYWELLEPQEGVFDLELVDGLIDQARREGVRLGLLWFGIWKNGASDYVPQWIKLDHSRYFTARDEKGSPLPVISPFCKDIVDLDERAFVKLMEHIKEYDGEQNTVIMVQVENEVGIWFHDRDFCEAANEMYEKEVPAEVASDFNVSGNWAEAFGPAACDKFMAYVYAKVVEQITAAGKKAYPLPMFVNTVVGAKDLHPAGGPDSDVHDVWKKYAPSVDFYSPDLYVPSFKEISEAFCKDGNPLFIPETNLGKNVCSNLIYAMGKHGCIGFNPFGIERLFIAPDPMGSAPPVPMGNDNITPQRGQDLKRTYRMVSVLWRRSERPIRKSGSMRSFSRLTVPRELPAACRLPTRARRWSYRDSDLR
ncbi:MAG: hypothetical protein E7233_06970 [Lachnospiraceae bacterium]|nr:hypothetical protein [Lachnospiraceae bacterium]